VAGLAAVDPVVAAAAVVVVVVAAADVDRTKQLRDQGGTDPLNKI
jgi:hypothetical protein